MSGSDLFTGTLDLLILRTVVRVGPVHGYAIGKAIRAGSDEVLSIEESALYPALHRLERKGLLDSAWGQTDTGRRAKFYRVTPRGLTLLEAETRRWIEFSGAVGLILDVDG